MEIENLKPDPYFITEAVLDDMIQKASRYKDKALLVVLYYFCPRTYELIGLIKDSFWVEGDKLYIRIANEKRQTERILLVEQNKYTYFILKYLEPKDLGVPVFRYGHNRNSNRLALLRLLKALNPKCTWQTFHYSMNARFLQGGIDHSRIMAWNGWRSTKPYDRLKSLPRPV